MIGLLVFNATSIIFSNITFESSEWAKLNAQSLKYDAVLDTVPKENSIVSMSWWMKISEKSWFFWL